MISHDIINMGEMVLLFADVRPQRLEAKRIKEKELIEQEQIEAWELKV